MNKRLLQEFLLSASSDNATALAEAKAYTIISPKIIQRSTMNGLLRLGKIYRAMQIIAETDGHPAQEEMLAFLDSNEFNFIQGEPTGDAQIQALDQLISIGLTQDVGSSTVDVSAGMAAIKPFVMAKANEESRPFESATLADIEYNRKEILDLQQNNSQHILNFTISRSAEDITTVLVEQRFGAEANDLTEWHPCGSTRVHYKQIGNYAIQVGASPTAYRELRLVSPVTLGLSVA